MKRSKLMPSVMAIFMMTAASTASAQQAGVDLFGPAGAPPGLVPPAGLTPQPPAYLAGYEGITYAGTLSGLHMWTAGQGEFVWVLSPDGKTAFLIEGIDDETVIATGVDMWGDTQPPSIPATPDVNANISYGLVLPAEMTAPPVAQPSTDGGDVSFRSNRALISSLPPAKQNAAMLRLMENLQDVKTPEEYRAAVEAWRSFVLHELAGKPPASTNVVAGPAVEVAPEAAGSSRAIVTQDAPLTAIPPVSPLVVDEIVTTQLEPAAVVAGEKTEAEKQRDEHIAKLLVEARENSFWFNIGADTAPRTVYMFADPACPFCARAFQTLRPAVDAGDLQIRVILVPAVSQNSPDIIAGLLNAPDAVSLLLDHSASVANRQGAVIPLMPFSSLPVQFQQAVGGNSDLFHGFQLPGVPFFIWDEEGEAKFLQGAPQGPEFSKASRDEYRGQN